MLSSTQEKIGSLLLKLWKNSSELRFNQFIYNLQRDFNQRHDKKYTVTLFSKEDNNHMTTYFRQDKVDLFNVEDALFLEFLVEEVVKLEGVALPAKAILKKEFNITSTGDREQFKAFSVVDVIHKVEHSSFKSNVGYVVMHPISHMTITLDSSHLDFNVDKEGKQ